MVLVARQEEEEEEEEEVVEDIDLPPWRRALLDLDLE